MAPYDDFSHTPRHYAPRAAAGDPQAQFYLGLALEALGPEAEARWGKAADWIRRAADGGLPDANLRLAQIELAGGDRQAALDRLDLAAAAGLPEAQFNRARLAEEDGDGESAERWYLAAARQGHGPSRYNLALLLIEENRPDGPTEALAWLTLAAEDGVPDAAPAYEALAGALDAEARAKAAALAGQWRLTPGDTSPAGRS